MRHRQPGARDRGWREGLIGGGGIGEGVVLAGRGDAGAAGADGVRPRIHTSFSPHPQGGWRAWRARVLARHLGERGVLLRGALEPRAIPRPPARHLGQAQAFIYDYYYY